jgi:hypothetical protein
MSQGKVDIEKLAERVYKLMLEEARREKTRGQTPSRKRR